MSEFTIENARIERAEIHVQDYGLLTCTVELRSGGSTGQCIPGYMLDGKPRVAGGPRSPHPALGLFVARLMRVASVANWSDVTGATVRVKRESGYGGPIVAVGHLIEDIWFEPRSEMEQLYREVGSDD